MDLLDIPSLAKGLNSSSRIIKAIDDLSEITGKSSMLESVIQTGEEIIKEYGNK